ncbi:hypothetical protein GUF51_16010, partial [Xanthomonas citri pv. citri]|nr:hypothetical protein [Xanthomonas citri pv. citri]
MATSGTFDATTLTLASAYTGTTVAYAEAYGRVENAHNLVTCSGRGACDTNYGTCTCMAGFTGSSCQKTKCPSDCWGKGLCLSL